MLRLAGWQFEGEPPRERKFVALAVPHTSNWDGAVLVALSQSIGLSISWMIKGSWVRGPMGVALRRVGAVAIDRSGTHNVVDSMVQEFRRRDELALALPPAGTRSRGTHWKSGFYHIAVGAGVPVVPGYLDYRRKRGGLGPALYMTGDVRADMDRIRAFYATCEYAARVPANTTPMRLASEE